MSNHQEYRQYVNYQFVKRNGEEKTYIEPEWEVMYRDELGVEHIYVYPSNVFPGGYALPVGFPDADAQALARVQV